MGKDDLTQIELQICIDFVNAVVQEEHDCKFVCFVDFFFLLHGSVV